MNGGMSQLSIGESMINLVIKKKKRMAPILYSDFILAMKCSWRIFFHLLPISVLLSRGESYL